MTLDNIKMLSIKALMHDEKLMYGLALKGGNALQLVYNITDRASMDIDFSIEGDFSPLDYERINSTLEALLNDEFQKENFVVFDIHFKEKPKSKKVPEWKGYNIEFKVTEKEKWFADNLEKTRREAIKMIGQSTKFSIDISSFEHIASAKKHDLDGTVLLVYTPEMIVIEKNKSTLSINTGIPRYCTYRQSKRESSRFL